PERGHYAVDRDDGRPAPPQGDALDAVERVPIPSVLGTGELRLRLGEVEQAAADQAAVPIPRNTHLTAVAQPLAGHDAGCKLDVGPRVRGSELREDEPRALR